MPRPVRALGFALLLTLAGATPAAAQAKVRVNWTAISGTQTAFWLAHEEGIFTRNGLDVELIHIPSTSRAIQAMLAGEVAFSALDITNVIEANLKGADMVLLAGVTNRLTFSVMARPAIKTMAELRGKRVGITRIGSSTHVASQVALGEAGLKPGDYTLLALTEVPNILMALTAGQVDAGILSPPTNTRARRAGLTELRNLAVDGPEYPLIAFGSTRAYVKANEDVARRAVRSYAEAVHLFKTNKPAAIRALQKYTKVKELDVLEDTYAQFLGLLESVPRISERGLETLLAEIREKDPKAKGLTAADVYDTRFLAALEAEGLFRKLWGK
jgi:ABC-type nitrate/sulfonate/bicarbonate transport system substrate-binding protein